MLFAQKLVIKNTDNIRISITDSKISYLKSTIFKNQNFYTRPKKTYHDNLSEVIIDNL